MFRLGWTIVKWGVVALLAIAVVGPFYLVALHYGMRPPEPLRSCVGPILGPGLLIRQFVLGVDPSLLRDDFAAHAAVVLGSVGFWLAVAAAIDLAWRRLLKAAFATGWRAAAFLCLVGMTCYYGLVAAVPGLAGGRQGPAFRLVFGPALLLDAVLGGSLAGGGGSAPGHLAIILGSWLVWMVGLLALRRTLASFRSKKPKPGAHADGSRGRRIDETL
jgi:hypothetical protein